jgi:hypothetical protein
MEAILSVPAVIVTVFVLLLVDYTNERQGKASGIKRQYS